MMNSSSDCCHCQQKIFRFKCESACQVCRSSCSCNLCSCFVQPPVPETETTGAIWRHPATETIVTTLLNKTNAPQTVTVSVLDWQNTCTPTEMPKDAYLCGNVVNPEDGPILTPFTFTIPANNLLTIKASPENLFTLPTPMYEVLVTYPIDPIAPVNPILPTGPVRPVITNTWGINAAGIPQEGNTMLHRQFALYPTNPI
ncbi:hypothetical protein [Lysinibacillus agricola]|uniref:hypothetical protein n=1 Tax=Lysinibacillus agricola TaxID=2590012 RepID=UPI003C2AC31A